MTQQEGALILAAGFSRRFGSDKRLAELPSGEPLLIATLEKYQAVFPTVAVLLRRDDQPVMQAIRDRFPRNTPLIMSTDHAEDGMGHSLADGVRMLVEWDFLFVGLADMPYVQRSTLRTLNQAMRRARSEGRACIVRPTYDDRPGHPVGFSQEFFPALIQLQGDQGARDLLKTNQDSMRHIPVDDPGVLVDIDQPADLRQPTTP